MQVATTGKSLLDVFACEFGEFAHAYYAAAIRSGRILVNGARVDARRRTCCARTTASRTARTGTSRPSAQRIMRCAYL